MRYKIYTVGKRDITEFVDKLPEQVLKNCGKKGVFMLGAADDDMHLVGVIQFYIRLMSHGEGVADITYVYVNEDSRRKGVASEMIGEIHKIMKKSGGKQCFTLLMKKQEEQQLFKDNGYFFVKPDAEAIGYFEDVHEKLSPMRMEQGTYLIEQ